MASPSPGSEVCAPPRRPQLPGRRVSRRRGQGRPRTPRARVAPRAPAPEWGYGGRGWAPQRQLLSEGGAVCPSPGTGSPGVASRSPTHCAQHWGRRRGSPVQAPADGAGGQLEGWSLLALPAASARRARADAPRPRTPPAPRGSRGGPNYAKLGRGVPPARTLGAGPGPRARVTRAPVAWSRTRLTGRSLPGAPATRRRASGRFVGPQRSGSARSLARSGGGGGRRSPNARAEASGAPWRPPAAVPPARPRRPGPAQPATWWSVHV